MNLGSGPLVCRLLLTVSPFVRSQNAGGPGERLECVPRCVVITFAGQGSTACIDSCLVCGAATAGRPIIQQLERCPGASNVVGKSAFNENRYWPGELPGVHNYLQRASSKVATRNMYVALGNESEPSLQYLHEKVGIFLSARIFLERPHQHSPAGSPRMAASALQRGRSTCRFQSSVEGCRSCEKRTKSTTFEHMLNA
jgi:hypothetical protein